jgi:hypothetical protein
VNYLSVSSISFAGYDKQAEVPPHVAIELKGVAMEVVGCIKSIFEEVVSRFAATEYFDGLHHYTFPNPSTNDTTSIGLHFLMATFRTDLAGNVEGRDIQAMHILATQIRANLQRHAYLAKSSP